MFHKWNLWCIAKFQRDLCVSWLDSSQDYTDSTGIDLHEFLVNTLKGNPRYAQHTHLNLTAAEKHEPQVFTFPAWRPGHTSI